MSQPSKIIATVDSTRAVRVIAGELGGKATLVPPTGNGYLLLAAETGSRPLWLPNLRRKRQLLARAKQAATTMTRESEITDVSIFDAIFAAPGRGKFLERRPGEVPLARFDLVVLVKADSPAAAARLRTCSAWRSLEEDLRADSNRTMELTATNVRRMGEVDQGRDGVFLFNFFFADDVEQNLAVWEHTAGWFQHHTNLNNSEVLLPAPESSDYTIINHCRWDHLTDFLPKFALNRGFRAHVLETFNVNDVAAIPILYRRA